MSGNPFRRSSLKGPAVGQNARADLDVSLGNQVANEPLFIDTSVRTTSQIKRVAFRSPPALPISPDSPVSAPPSPLASRLIPAPGASTPISEQTSVFGEAYPQSLFDAGISADQDGPVLIEARRNAAVNSAVVSGAQPPPQEDSVQTTLSKFASRPAVVTASVNIGADASLQSSRNISSKATMDVDSFTRLLLTGDRMVSSKSATPQGSLPSGPSASETSSSADTASISRQSIFEPMAPIIAETPRTSHELDKDDAEDTRRDIVPGEVPDRPKKPPPPKARHGKPLVHATSAENDSQYIKALNVANVPKAPSTNVELPTPISPTVDSVISPGSTGTNLNRMSKQPPPPPLSRRRSSNRHAERPDLARANSTRSAIYSQRRMSASSISPLPGNGIPPPPPPPPARRTGTGADCRPSAESGAESQESSPIEEPQLQARPVRPPPPPSRHSSTKRSSQVLAATPPPPPPPRRGYSSQRQSFDLSRANNTSEPEDLEADEKENKDVIMPASNATDILAEIARLQREVDGAMKAQKDNG